MENAQQVCDVCAQPFQMCAFVHTLEPACASAELKVNSLRLSESTLKSGDCGDSGKGREREEGSPFLT